MKIETKRMCLRTFEEDDLNDLFEYASQDGVFDMAGWKHYEKIKEALTLLDKWKGDENRFALTLKESGKVIGHINVKPDSEDGRKDTKELGFSLNRDYHRKGYMSEAVIAILNYLFNNGTEYVYACCFNYNVPSKGLIEKCGFRFDKNGIYTSKTLNKTMSTYEYVYTKDMWEKRKH